MRPISRTWLLNLGICMVAFVAGKIRAPKVNSCPINIYLRIYSFTNE